MSERLPTQVSPSCRLITSVGSSEEPFVEVPLFKCTNDDAVVTAVPTNTAPLASYVPVDVYGSLGFERLVYSQQTDQTRAFWRQCNTICYFDGPENESMTLSLFERFRYRWSAIYEDGYFYYGSSIIARKQVSSVLFPTAVAEFDKFSVCFEQNNTLIFAVERAGEIELRRLQAGVLTTITFLGASPVLFLNSELQPDLGYQDVVCYYLLDGNLYGRWQRDNFAVEYLLIEDVEVNVLCSVRSSQIELTPYAYLFCLYDCSTRLLISSLYPIWAQERFNANALLLAGDVDFVIIALPPETDSFSAVSVLVDDGDCGFVTLTTSGSDSFSASSVLVDNGDLFDSIIIANTASDSFSASSVLYDNGDLYDYIVNGGSYAETFNAAAVLVEDGNCENE